MLTSRIVWTKCLQLPKLVRFLRDGARVSTIPAIYEGSAGHWGGKGPEMGFPRGIAGG